VQETTPVPLESHAIAELMHRCIQGDDAARATFLLEFGEVVQRAVARKIAACEGAPALRSEASDIANDVLARLLADDCRLLKTVRDPARIRAWLVTVAQRGCIDALRRRAAQVRAEDAMRQESEHLDMHAPSPAELACRREQQERAQEALGQLSSKDRLIMELYYFQDVKYVDIAAILAININTVAARLHRAKNKLRKALERHDVRP
jgi:RNA polymerase sigma-70 factor (ECF subfamily)